MTELWDGFVKALQLIASFDPEVMEIAGRSLAISATSCTIATLLCVPLGALIHFNTFRGKRLLISAVQTLFSLPTVAVGLIVFVLFSRAGPLGGLGLLFTPSVMVIGQVMLISPIMLGLIISALSGVDRAVTETATALGASSLQSSLLTIREARYAMVTAVIMGFGRAISEVGLSLMVGGNIRGFTRTITTAISLETSKGDVELAMALGIILILIALVINIALNRLQQR
ncbi:MAG: ABC transporter permease [Chloroflexota bacterium]|nr:ABC transporter permease [Chloroflexota bacterium]